MKNIFLGFVLISISAFAQVSQISLDDSATNWSAEGHFNTISNSLTAMFGPTLFYKLNSRNQLGLRFLAPVGSAETETYSMMAVGRHHFSERKSHLFVEGSMASNWYLFRNSGFFFRSSSVGTNLGIVHQLNEDLSFGGLAGVEWMRTRIGANGAYDSTERIYAWSRLALFAALAF